MEKDALTQLVIRSQSGDMVAIEALLELAYTPVSYQCRKFLNNPQDIEDITQEILLNIYTKIGSLQEPAAFWGWLNQMTANRCINELKRGHKELQFAEDEEGHSILDNIEEVDEQQIPDKALDNAETARMIEELVDALPEAQRMCTILYYYDEMSVKEIAQVMGTSENTVKSRLNYARKAIKERVLDYEKDGVKLYSLSPLPFLLYFLRRNAARSTDGAAAKAMVGRVVSIGAGTGAAAAGSAAASAGAASAAGAGAAMGKAVAGHVLSKAALSTIAGILAGVVAVGGIAAGVAAVTDWTPSKATVAQQTDPETEAEPETTITQPDTLNTQSEEPSTEPTEEVRIVAEDILSGLPYTGDITQCRMTVEQANAYAQIIEDSITHSEEAAQDSSYPAFCRVALFDAGDGNPALWVTEGTHIYENDSGYMPSSSKIYVWDGTQTTLAVEKDSSNLILTPEGLLVDSFPGMWDRYSREVRHSALLYEVSGGRIGTQPIAVYENYCFEQSEIPTVEELRAVVQENGSADINYDYGAVSSGSWTAYGYGTGWLIGARDGHFDSIENMRANGQHMIYSSVDWVLGHGQAGHNDADHDWAGIWGDGAQAAQLLRSSGPSSEEPENTGISIDSLFTASPEGSLYATMTSYDAQAKIQRATLVPPEGSNLEVWYEIPVFDLPTQGYQAINRYFLELRRDYFSDPEGSIAFLLDRREMLPNEKEIPYSHTNSITILTQTNSLVSVKQSSYWFAGSSDVQVSYFTFSTAIGELLELSDMIDGTPEELKELIISALTDAYGESLWDYDSPDSYELDDFVFYVENGQIYVMFRNNSLAIHGMKAVPLSAQMKPEWQ